MALPKTQSELDYCKNKIANPQSSAIDAYPYLNPIIEKGLQTRHFKKTKFIYDNLYTVNDKIVQQIKENESSRLNKKVDKIMSEKKTLRDNQKMLTEEVREIANSKL